MTKTKTSTDNPLATNRQLKSDPLVELKISLPDATSVAVAGTFNNWDPQRTPLRHEGGGLWRVFLPLNTGRYEYRFVVDGQWQEDPSAKESVTNPFGGRNSVLKVAGQRQRPVATAVAA